MKRALLLGFSMTLACLRAASWTDYFEIGKIPDPAGIDPQVGAMDVLPDGRLAVAFHRGEVMLFDPLSQSWSLFASGLQEPLGMLAQPDGSLLVMQRAELTCLRDMDKDGRADRYETFFDAFGMTGNYHEFSYGPVRDKDGSLYVVLGVASNLSPNSPEVRGRFSPIGGLSQEQMALSGKEWDKVKAKAGRMYSRVPWRGWVLKLAPDGKSFEPYACGFRSPDGIGFDAEGRLLVTDNQGDWRPTSPLYQVRKDGFYGHPASLVWKPDWDGRDPLAIPSQELDRMQVPAAGYFPQGELANSPTQPVAIPAGAFPPGYGRQTIIGEMNQPTLIRVLNDEVDGTFQVGLVPFLDKSPLGIGSHRLAFGKDGSLYVGKTALAWAGDTGITRVKWNGKPFFSLDGMKALPAGFRLTFSEAIDPASATGVTMKRNTYKYHAEYGSPKVDEAAVPLKAVVADDGLSLVLECGPLKERYLHALDLTSLRSRAGSGLLGDRVWYQVVKAPR